MIRNVVTMDREDIIRILAEKYGVGREKVKLYYIETVIEDDIRAEILLENPYHKEAEDHAVVLRVPL